ncbi:MAG: EamA family transporter [Candidatus Eisenbacteria bacterium]|uniref:EamA family transporter n=1 Tax=Eiseniibacteriota bacterium TaxID=2212470 RepID=A0A937XD87_UNCEI|nr:EamA family transporter [Candidatus Eisenbacteria bacterium]
MTTPLALVLVAVCFSVTGELFLKEGMARVGVVTLPALGQAAARMVRTWQLFAGLGSIGVGAAFWLAALSRVDLSWAYPLLAIGYVLILLFSALILREQVSAVRWLGAALIIIGVILVSRS